MPWSETLSLLERELSQLHARAVVIEADFREQDIRLDGWPRANASPESPAVIVSFESKEHGPLRYPCDTFTQWQANVRAIALALEALRKVDRYGVTRRGEQYAGWKKLPGPGGSTATMDIQAAAQFLAAAAGTGADAAELQRNPVAAKEAHRAAAKRLHPDVGGSSRDFATLGEAKRALDTFHGK